MTSSTSAQFFAGLSGRRRECDDDPRGMFLSDCFDSAVHGGSRCQPIVNENYGSAARARGRRLTAVEAFASGQFPASRRSRKEGSFIVPRLLLLDTCMSASAVPILP